MVERYKQPELPSLVVGTPGVDQSAGAAAGAVAKVAEQSTAEQGQFAQQEIQAGANDLNNFVGNATYLGMHALRQWEERKRQQRNLQDDLAFQFEKPKIDTALDQEAAQLKSAMAGGPDDPTAPRGATKVWNDNTQNFLQGIRQQYQDQPGLLKRALDYAAQGRVAQGNALDAWAPSMVTANLGLKTDAIPQQYKQAIGNAIDYNQSLPQIEQAFQKTTIDNLQPISALLKQTAAFPDASARNKTVELQNHISSLATDGAKQVLQNAISMVPLDQGGLAKLDQIEAKIKNPNGSPFVLAGNAPQELLSQIDSQRKAVIEGASQQYKTNALAIQAHADSVIASLNENFNTPSLRDQNFQTLVAMKQGVEKSIASAEALPDSNPLKLPQMESLKGALNTIVGGEGSALSKALSFAGQEKANYYLAQSVAAAKERNAREAAAQQKQDLQRSYNAELSAVRDRIQQFNAMPPGPDKLAEGQNIYKTVQGITEKYNQAGILSHGEIDSVNHTYGLKTLQAAQYRMTAGIPVGMPGATNISGLPVVGGIVSHPATIPGTPAGKQALDQQVVQQAAALSKAQGTAMDSVDTMIKLGKHLSMSPQEGSYIETVINNKWPAAEAKMLAGDPQHNVPAMTSAQVDAARGKWLDAYLQHFRSQSTMPVAAAAKSAPPPPQVTPEEVSTGVTAPPAQMPASTQAKPTEGFTQTPEE